MSSTACLELKRLNGEFMIKKLVSAFGFSNAYHAKVQDRYRPDVDGMRALAVLPVFLFHLDIDLFSGGYIGVDIFFVISGYLISGILLRANESQGFQFKQFYAKRAKRILPAFYVTVVLTLAGAALLMPPRFFAEAAESAFYAVLSISNIYFWFTSGYFDTAVLNKPFLHTWSLSVEEQYYVLWPAIIHVMYRMKAQRYFPHMVIALTILSFGAAQWALRDHATASFYLLPFRFGELALGALAAWYRPSMSKLSGWKLEVITVLAIVMMVGPILFYTAETPFPGVAALIPCLGAFLIAGFGASKIAGAFFWWRPAIGVGLVSYSMYLLHWPVIILYRARFGEEPGLLAVLLILIGVGIGSYLMFRFVEQPFRGQAFARHSQAFVGFLAAMGALVLIVGSSVIWTQDGWPDRFGTNVAALQELNQEQRVARARALRRECHLQSPDQRHIDRLRLDECLTPAAGAQNVLIVGSSYGADDAMMLQRAFQDVNWLQLTTPGCVPVPGASRQSPPACRMVTAEIGSRLDAGLRPDYIVLSHNWTAASLASLQSAIDYYSSRAPEVVVFGPRGRMRTDILDIATGLSGDLNDVVLSTEYQASDLDELQAAFAEASLPDNVHIFDIADMIWGGAGVPLMPVEDRLFFIDQGHYSVEGATYLARRLRRDHEDFGAFASALAAEE
jgi:peptidoglycan/LPS O-acetylase OafA/YrhL